MPKPRSATSLSPEARALLDAIAGKMGGKSRTAALEYAIRKAAEAEGLQSTPGAAERGQSIVASGWTGEQNG